MAFNIAIIDDEELLREKIAKLVNWESLGLNLMWQAKDGVEALEKTKKYHLDIALVDICMPKMDGLEYAKNLLEIYPESKIIIITGYDEFDYAREAIKIGVKEYILKPITKLELEDLLKRMVEKLKKERVKEEHYEYAVKNYNENIKLMREKFLNNIIYEEISIDSYYQKMKNLKLIDFNKFYLMIIGIDHMDRNRINDGIKDLKITKISVKSIVEKIAQDIRIITFDTYDEEIGVLFFDSEINKEKMYQKILEKCRIMQNMIKKKLGYTVSIGISKNFEEIKDANIAYFESKKALNHRFFIGNNVIIEYESVSNNVKSKQTYLSDSVLEIENKIKEHNKENVQTSIQNIFNMMIVEKIDERNCKEIITTVLIYMIKYYVEKGVQLENVFENELYILETMEKMTSLNEIEDWVLSIYDKLYNYLENYLNHNKIQIMKVERYIETNYNNGELSLKNICENVHLSPSYFSTIFKKETGQTIIGYLTNVRMNKARELLRNKNMKTYEVAEAIGYSDPNYFSTVFKKTYFISPSQYRIKRGKK